MKVLSLFSGVGGFDLGLERAGMETVFQCEWDKHATKILERHWPDVPRWGDVSTLTGAHVLQHAPVVDVVAWGSPCQDLSVAGKRAGLGGERSGLFHEGVRIIKEMREITNGKYPRMSIWENVAGALSSGNGADFGQVLYEMDEAGACFSEWRLLDAQYFGVPQRRRRVFLVSVFDPATAARCPDPLLPVSESVRRDTEEGATTREEPTGTIAQGFGSGSFGGWTETNTAITLSARDHKSSNTLAVEPFTGTSHAQYGEGVGTLRANGGDLGGGSETLITFTKSKQAQTVDDNETWVEDQPALTLNAFDQGDTRTTAVVVGPVTTHMSSPRGSETTDSHHVIIEPIVAIPIHDQATRHSGKRGDKSDGKGNGLGIGNEGDPMNTLTSGDRHAVATTMLSFDTKFGSNANVFEDQTPTLKALQAAPSVAYTLREREGKPGGGKGPLISEEKSGTLAARANDQTIFQPTQTTAFQPGTMIRMSGGVWDELAPTLRAEAKRGDNEPHVAIQYYGYNQKINDTDVSVTLRLGRDSSDFVAQPVDAAGFKPGASANAHSIGYEEGLSPSLEAGGGGNNRPAVLEPTMAVRRLTPVECERLMGWPDDWTSGQADTHRYKQCGNGVASPVATWIGQQLMELDR